MVGMIKRITNSNKQKKTVKKEKKRRKHVYEQMAKKQTQKITKKKLFHY